MLGSGGTDLASKYQILAYFEKVLKKLEGTGQLKFYPQCRYNGEGRLTSVLNPELECVVDVTRKVVDASYLTNITRYPVMMIREGWLYQIGRIFGKIPNGLCPPLIFGKSHYNFF